MTEKKGRTTNERHDPEQDLRHSTDPLIAWHALGKPARQQQRQQRTWRRKNGGRIAAELLGLLALATVAVLLLAGGAR